jgi:hypothetical protein
LLSLVVAEALVLAAVEVQEVQAALELEQVCL